MEKAISVLDDALEGKVVNPVALSTAIQMTQFFWSSVYSERVREKQIADALRHKWQDTIEDK